MLSRLKTGPAASPENCRLPLVVGMQKIPAVGSPVGQRHAGLQGAAAGVRPFEVQNACKTVPLELRYRRKLTRLAVASKNENHRVVGAASWKGQALFFGDAGV